MQGLSRPPATHLHGPSTSSAPCSAAAVIGSRRKATPPSPPCVGLSCPSPISGRISGSSTQHRPCALAKQQAAGQQQQAQGQWDRSKGRSTYRPASFGEMVNDAVLCVLDGIRNGLTRMEVEFPPVPTRLDGYKGASDVFIDANVQLALAGARKLAEAGRKVHVVVPDQGEYDRTYRMFKASLEVIGAKVTMGHLREFEGVGFSLQGLFKGYAPESKEAAEAADTYIIINATCIELLNVREYVNRLAPQGSNKAVVLWNLELDTLRGDLGLPAFPPKEIHYSFLSSFRPVFYLRARDYSKSVPVAPFLINYSGALFREYPGPWQVMLKQDSGEYACIAEDRARYNLGELKEELQAAMGLDTEEEGSAMQVLRRGLKNSTWFEDDYEQEASHEWRL